MINHWEEILINTEETQSQLLFCHLNTWLLKKKIPQNKQTPTPSQNNKIHTPILFNFLERGRTFLAVSPREHNGCNCSELWWNERKKFYWYISGSTDWRTWCPLICCQNKVRLISLQRENLIHSCQANTVI